jgi:hypothetical protein
VIIVEGRRLVKRALVTFKYSNVFVFQFGFYYLDLIIGKDLSL